MIRITWLAIVLLLCCVVQAAKAQNIRLIDATEQRWSGGVAGRSGANYNFTIAFRNTKSDFAPDTLWIGQYPMKMMPRGSIAGSNGNYTTVRKGNTVTIEINAGIEHDEYEDRYPTPGKEQKLRPHAPIAYNGVALLSYHAEKTRKYFVITKIMKQNPPINYP